MDLGNLMGKMQEMQGKMKEAQENLQFISVEGEAGAGLVKVMVNGKKQIIKIDIDESIIAPDKKNIVQDLTVAATNQALLKIEPLIQEEIKKHTGNLMPSIPGFDLGSLFK